MRRPVGSNPKEQQFLQELEDLFEYVEVSDFEKFHDDFLRRFVQLLEAPHFQTTERALWFWRNPSFNELAVKQEKFGASLLRALFEPLQRNTLEHWHDSVKSMSEEILQTYQMELPRVYDECVNRYNAAHAAAAAAAAAAGGGGAVAGAGAGSGGSGAAGAVAGAAGASGVAGAGAGAVAGGGARPK
jgi:hypothetical protein